MRNDQSVTVRRPVITAAPLEAVRLYSPDAATQVCRALPAAVLPQMGYEQVRDELEPGWEYEVGTFPWHIQQAKRAQAEIARTYAAKGGAR